jgi:hypothetical protein
MTGPGAEEEMNEQTCLCDCKTCGKQYIWPTESSSHNEWYQCYDCEKKGKAQ